MKGGNWRRCPENINEYESSSAEKHSSVKFQLVPVKTRSEPERRLCSRFCTQTLEPATVWRAHADRIQKEDVAAGYQHRAASVFTRPIPSAPKSTPPISDCRDESTPHTWSGVAVVDKGDLVAWSSRACQSSSTTVDSRGVKCRHGLGPTIRVSWEDHSVVGVEAAVSQAPIVSTQPIRDRRGTSTTDSVMRFCMAGAWL
eukprot:m.8668 g.8668  ORF g.8668 m.8668 type:complete len:200 (+) comp4086_c0_seq1:107-706(+)